MCDIAFRGILVVLYIAQIAYMAGIAYDMFERDIEVSFCEFWQIKIVKRDYSCFQFSICTGQLHAAHLLNFV